MTNDRRRVSTTACERAMRTDRPRLTATATAAVSILLLLTSACESSSPSPSPPPPSPSPPPPSPSPSPPPSPSLYAAHVCCATATGWGDRNCTRGGRAYHTVETVGGPCDPAAAPSLHVRKCCPPGRTYDAGARLCRRAAAGDHGRPDTAYRRRLLLLLLPRPPEPTAPVAVAYDYDPPACGAREVLVDVLVDVPADDVRLLLSRRPVAAAAAADDYCLDFAAGPPGREPGLVVRACRPRDQYCRRDGRYTCVNKCCKGGKAILGKSCKKSDVPFRADVYDDRAANDDTLLLVRSDRAALPYYERLNCTDRDRLPAGEFVLTADGSIYRPGPGVRVPAARYCLENEQRDDGGGGGEVRAFVCAEPYSPDAQDSAGSWKYALTLAGFVPSIVCLALTLAVYAALSSLRNVHGYYVMCYVACLLLAFVCLLVIQWATVGFGLCKFFGYLTLFAFLTTFCWLNVICFDIYWMVRYNNPINKNKTISVRTILYNIYCWGFSSLCTLTAFLFQHSQDSTLLKFAPTIGIRNCWFFTTDYGTVIFFLLPLSIMLIANLILFVLTAIHCSKIKSELNKFKRTDSKSQRFQIDKEKFVMSIKLFLVMGIPWSFEIMSRIFPNEGIIWHILDEINALQGVMIFVIFVAKRKVITNIRKKISGSFHHSESTKMNTISGSSHCSSAHKNNNNDF